MSEDLSDWKPMEEDFESLTFNSYEKGQTAAMIPCHLLQSILTPENKSKQNVKLYVDGFPSDLTEGGLKNFFTGIGCEFSSLQIIRNEELIKTSRPFAFVDFKSTKAAQNCIQLIKSQKLFKLCVYLTSSQNEIKIREQIKNQEFEEFEEQFYEQNGIKRVEDNTKPIH